MKIYTKAGDDGRTGLFHGPRVAKDDCRIEAYGSVDELSSVIGVARGEGIPSEIDVVLVQIQQDLFDLGAELATPDPDRHGTRLVTSTHTAWVETTIDRFEDELPPLTQFILPGGCRSATLLHHARTVCRRAERRIVSLQRETSISAELVIYLNRIGDLLFVLARWANQVAGCGDVPWQGAKKASTDRP